MSNCAMLSVGFPPRKTLSTTYSSKEYEINYLGRNGDSSNLDLSAYPEWVASKTDYSVGDYVKISALGKGYVCGIDNTRVYPEVEGVDWKGFTLNEFAVFDGAPARQSKKSYVSGENIEFILNVERADNILFAHNMLNIKSVKVESLDINDNVLEILDEKDLTTFLSFELCTPCSSIYDFERNYSLNISPCNAYTKIKLTLLVVDNIDAKIGTVAVANNQEVGDLTEYVTVSGESTTKIKKNLADNNLDIDKGYTTQHFSVKADMLTRKGRNVDRPINLLKRFLLDNSSQICFYNFGFENEDDSKIIGFHTVPNLQVGGYHSKPVSLDIYTAI